MMHSVISKPFNFVYFLILYGFMSILVMDSGQKILIWVRSFFCCSGWVGSATSGFGKFPLKNPNFSIFFLSCKKNLSEVRSKNTWVIYLRVKSTLGSGQGASLVYSSTLILGLKFRSLRHLIKCNT